MIHNGIDRLLTPGGLPAGAVFAGCIAVMGSVFIADVLTPADIRLHSLYVSPLAAIALHCYRMSMVLGGLGLSIAFQLTTFLVHGIPAGPLVTDVAVAITSSVLTVVLSRIARDREMALRASHQTLHSILESALDGFCRADGRGKLLDVNPAYCRQSGYSRAELLGMAVFDLAPSENAAATGEHMRRIVERGSDQFESVHRRKDGSEWHVEVSVAYHGAAGGQFFAFFRDITERKLAAGELEVHRHHLELLVEERANSAS